MRSGEEFIDFRRTVAATPRKRSTRVLLVAPYMPRGGGMGRIMAHLATQGAAAGVTFKMVESRGGGSAICSAWHMVCAGMQLIRFAFAREFIIVHLNAGENASLLRKGALLLLADLLGMRTVLHLHAADIMGCYQRIPRGLQRALGIMFRRADMCVVLGTMWQDWLIKECGVARARITIIHNGVPQSEVVPVKLAGDEFSLAFLGNLLPRKGLADLLHALADVPRSRTWRLVIAGSGDDRHLRDLADNLGILGRLMFTGWLERDAATDLLRCADALVLPSYHEALPLVLLEAASLGTPMIATRVGAIPELFTDFHDALLVAPGDRVALTRAILRLIDDPALRQGLAENARRLYADWFTLDAFASRFGAIYARLAAAG